MGVTNYTYNAANQLVSDGTNTLTYDNNGNLTSDGVNSYTWDRANRLLSMGGVDYQYDGEGRRVQQTVSSVVTKYLLDIQPGLAVVLSETTGANTMRYVHSPRGIHAHKDASNNWEWTVQDGLGSVREVVDNSVGVLESRNYDPYGNAFGATGTSQTGFGFTGELVDGSGLLDLRARRYNAAMGTFASLDPFEGKMCRPMSMNGYSWVEGNVPNGVDPSGMIFESPYIWDRCGSGLIFAIAEVGGSQNIEDLIKQVQELQERVCEGDGVCGPYKDYYKDNFSPPDPCFKSFDNMCQSLCGGTLLDDIWKVSHDGKGLFERWIEYGMDILNLDNTGRDNHADQYDKIERILKDTLDNWRNQDCQTTGDNEALVSFMEIAEEWSNKALPFAIIPQICILGTCYRLPDLRWSIPIIA